MDPQGGWVDCSRASPGVGGTRGNQEEQAEEEGGRRSIEGTNAGAPRDFGIDTPVYDLQKVHHLA